MSFQITNNNTFTTTPTSPNPYVSRKINNMDQAQVMKRKREDWERTYHKMLKGLETMIDMQRMIKDIKKLAEEVNTTLIEAEGMILNTSINNRTMNAMNITQISEDLWYMVQSNIEEQMFQTQRMLADKLDQYKGKGNKYVKDNIQEIQELYIEEGNRGEKGRVEDEEVILIKPYEVSMTTSSSSSTSFIKDEVKNLLKYMKFVQTPSQMRIFKPPPHYQSLKSRGKQDPIFWNKVTKVFLEKKHNTDTARNRCQIHIFQEGPLHEPYFIAINNREQVIISPGKRIVATHVVEELEVLV